MIFDWLAITLLLSFAIPAVVYLSVKLGTFAYYRARRIENESHSTESEQS